MRVLSVAGYSRHQEDRLPPFTSPGIKKLSPSSPSSRTNRNPDTGAKIKIPAKMVGEMKVAQACKEVIVPGRKK
jgi:hypothetical protein